MFNVDEMSDHPRDKEEGSRLEAGGTWNDSSATFWPYLRITSSDTCV